MKILIAITIFTFLKVCSANDFINCTEKQFKKEKIESITINAVACISNDGHHSIKIKFNTTSKNYHTLKLSAEGAYTLNFNREIDINNDGILDLGISNGKGRGGDGMYYFLAPSAKSDLIFLGEYPALKRTSDSKNVLFSLSSGSGDVISTRYEYLLSGKILQIDKIIMLKITPKTNNAQLIYFNGNSTNELRKLCITPPALCYEHL